MNSTPSVAQLPRHIQIFLPFYGNGKTLNQQLGDLAEHLPSNCTVYAIDCGPVDAGVQIACDAISADGISLEYVRCGETHSFVEACRWAFDHLWTAGNDLLLLDSEVTVTAGFLQELQAVLHLHEKNAVVTPRTDKASIFSLPSDRGLSPLESFSLWTSACNDLPRYQLVPTSGSFCMLIKSEVLRQLGLFDKSTTDEVNGFLCRINRVGYSSLLANHAYVFCPTLGICDQTEDTSSEYRPTLAEVYPEFERRMDAYLKFEIDPCEHFASLYLEHRPRILYDLSHLSPQHSGTSDFALSLLRELEPLAQKEYDVYVRIGEAQRFFLNELRGYLLYDESQPPIVFDLAYRPSHMFRWDDFANLNRLAPRIAFTLLDMIAVRCGYIGNAGLPALIRQTVELSDKVFTISEFTRSDFNAFYSLNVEMPVIHLGARFAAESPSPRGGYILILGNSFAHKGVSGALQQLGEIWPIVLLGVEKQPTHPNARFLTAGGVSRRDMHDLFLNAEIVVYPSYYEGYGLPVVDALALGKPVIVLDTSVNREIATIANQQNLHRIASLDELAVSIRCLRNTTPHPGTALARRWSATAADYHAEFQSILNKRINVEIMRQRWETLRPIEAAEAAQKGSTS